MYSLSARKALENWRRKPSCLWWNFLIIPFLKQSSKNCPLSVLVLVFGRTWLYHSVMVICRKQPISSPMHARTTWWFILTRSGTKTNTWRGITPKILITSIKSSLIFRLMDILQISLPASSDFWIWNWLLNRRQNLVPVASLGHTRVGILCQLLFSSSRLSISFSSRQLLGFSFRSAFSYLPNIRTL